MTTLLRDRYTVGALIGAGGAGRVHIATDRVLGRRVAVKVLDDDIARSADPAGRDRFLAEVRTAASIEHPNLVSVYDAGEDAGELFLVMEYVDGVTLAELLARRGPLPVDEAVSIATQMLDGLAAMHRQGTIHRDVKPANVLVGHDGRVRLADFGIAKQLDDIADAVTATGTFVGSPGYVAPEQAAGSALTVATDVFQVGVVLHEMLTGERHGGAAQVPAPMSSVVARATAPDPDDRFPTAASMRSAIESAALGSAGHTLVMPVEAQTAVLDVDPVDDSDGGGHRALLVAIVLGVAALVIALAVVAGRTDDDGVVTPATPATAPGTVASVPTTITLAVPVVTSPPESTTPATPEPEGGRGQGRNNGKGKDKKDD